MLQSQQSTMYSMMFMVKLIVGLLTDSLFQPKLLLYPSFNLAMVLLLMGQCLCHWNHSYSCWVYSSSIPGPIWQHGAFWHTSRTIHTACLHQNRRKLVPEGASAARGSFKVCFRLQIRVLWSCREYYGCAKICW